MKNTVTPRLMAVFVLALFALVAGCGQGPRGADGNKKGEDGEDEEATPVPVEIAIVSTGDAVAAYSGTAALEAEQEAMVVAKVAGEVIGIAVEEGDRVKAGQVLARLDGDRLRLELARAGANLKKLEQEYQRNVDLYDKGLVSSGAYEGLKYELEALRSAYSLAKLELDYTAIRAPIDGVIAERHIKLGNTITVNSPAFLITDLDPLLAYLHLPERDFSKLKPEQPAAIEVDALPGQIFMARVARVSPVIDPASGTFKVTIEVPDETASLKPGMFGRFNIEYDRRVNTVLVPRAAMLRDDDKASVFVVEDDVAKRRVVTTGYSSGTNLEIVDGLEAGEEIIVVGQAGLNDGNPVRVVNRTTDSGDGQEEAESALASGS
ncbi:MAG: efflux RND transporter periplasmic adaptor subunit [Gammaproteobacteria bacterium]|nr:efflux RND transporter periplasmic adaptor subunit [Gammaproteobacteria bacterium]